MFARFILFFALLSVSLACIGGGGSQCCSAPAPSCGGAPACGGGPSGFMGSYPQVGGGGYAQAPHVGGGYAQAPLAPLGGNSYAGK